MAINFPTNPNNGDVHAGFTYNSTKSVWESVAPSMMPTSDTPPTSPSDGQMWFDTDGGGAFVYYEDTDSSQWVEVIGSAGAAGADGATGSAGADGSAAVYATVDDLPGTASAGDQAFVTASNRLYLWNGTGWYNIALINTNPSISGASASYGLASDGTPTVVTITASDPEGLPITYSIASDTSGNIATVTQNANVFTITPTTNTANGGTFSLTFRASDGVNVASAVSSFTLQFSVENSNYTTALITSVGGNNADNNDFVDSSTNSHTITAAGNATQTTFSPYRHGGYSTYFDGSGEYLQLSASNDWGFGTGAWTVEFWINTIDTDADVVAAFNASSPFAGWSIRIASGLVQLFVSDGSSNEGFSTISGTTIVNDSVWHHVVVTSAASSNTVSCYVDGVLAGSNAFSIAISSTGQILRVGADTNSSPSRPLAGYLTDVRIVKGSQVYTSAFTPPTERLTAITNTSLLTCHLPYFADGSTNDHTITVNGNTHIRSFTPYDASEYSSSSHGGSMYFDGTGDYLTVAHDTTLKPGTSGAFSIEFWYYPTAHPSGNPAQIAGDLGVTSYPTNCHGFDITHATDGQVGFRWGAPSYQDSSSGDGGAITNNIMTLNTWHHIVVCRNAESTATMALFLNGKRCWYESGSQVSIADATASNFYVGYAGSASGTTFLPITGAISNFKFRKGATSYDPTSATYTVPVTAPLTSDTETSLLLKGTNAGIIDKSQSSSQLILDADTKCSSTQTKYRSTAIYTDGTGDRVRFGINNKNLVCDWGVGGEPFTVEWWMYDTQPYTAQHSFGPQTGGGAGAWNSSTGHQWITYWNNSVLNIYYYGTNGTYNGNTCTASQLGIVQNQWQHIAHTYDGTTWRLYVDGVHGFHWVLPNQPANVSGTYAALGSFAEAAYYTAAYYDDVRITKGLARYTGTSSFTPPAEALKG